MQRVGQEQCTTPCWVGVGRSDDADPIRAGKEAAARAVTGDAIKLRGSWFRETRGGPAPPDIKLLLVFSDGTYPGPALLQGIRAVAREVPLIGCSTAGGVTVDGPGSANVAVVAIGGEGYSVVPAVSRDISGRVHDAGVEIARSVAQLPDAPHRMLLMLLTDDVSGSPLDLVRGAYSVVGGTVPLVGGCAVADVEHTTCQYFGDEALTDSAVAVALASDTPIGIGVEHSLRRVGEPMLVTRSAGNVLYELDDEPALDVYLDRLAAPEDARHDHDAFNRFALTHPLGLASRRGEVARHTMAADFLGRSFGSAAEIPEGGMAWLMEGDDASVMRSAHAAVEAALGELRDHPPLALLTFECIARRAMLSEAGVTPEIHPVSAWSDGTPVAGLYTFGEIARANGINGYHNQTLVVLALS